MKVRALVLTAVATLTPTLMIGCSDDDAGGNGIPSADNLVEILKDQGMTEDMAECMGGAYEAAGFTADDLRNMGENAPDADSEKYIRFAEEAQACTGTDISVPSGG